MPLLVSAIRRTFGGAALALWLFGLLPVSDLTAAAAPTKGTLSASDAAAVNHCRFVAKDRPCVADLPEIIFDSDYEIREEEFAGARYVGHRDTVSFDGFTDFFAEHFHAMHEAIQSAGVEIAGPPSGIYWWWDEQAMQTFMAAAIPIKSGDVVIDGYDEIEIGPGRAVVTDHFGTYEASAAAHEAIDAYLDEHNLGQPSVVIEEYVSDPSLEPDASKWHTRIIYLLDE